MKIRLMTVDDERGLYKSQQLPMEERREVMFV